MRIQEHIDWEKRDRNKAFICFLNNAQKTFHGKKFRNSDYFKDNYNLKFEIMGKPYMDFPLSAKLYFGNRAFASFKKDDTSVSLSEYGASLSFNQQPNCKVSILLHYPYVSENSSFNGLNIGIVSPHRLMKKSYQNRLFRILVTSMEKYSYAGSPSLIDNCLMRYYKAVYRQVNDGIEFECKFISHIWAILEWAICGIIGGYIAGFTASRFPTTIKNSQFERCDSILVRNMDELSSIKQELINCTTDYNKQDSLNEIILEALKKQTTNSEKLYHYLIKCK